MSTLVVACGALVRELRAVLAQLPFHEDVDVEYLPAPLHNRPERIVPSVRAVVDSRGHEFDRVVIGYADCGTGGGLDALVSELGAERLPGAHCYELFAGADVFAALHDAEPGTFYLTDYLARYFDQLVVAGLGLDRHPHLRDVYFGNYRRLCYLAQSHDAALVDAAHAAAERLGLEFVHRPVGLTPFATAVADAVGVLVRR